MSSIFSTAESFFQMELNTYNDPDKSHTRKIQGKDPTVVCEVGMQQTEDIIPNSSGYSVACTGWSLSTSQSLVYQPINTDVSITYGRGKYDATGKHDKYRREEYETRVQDKKTYNFIDLMNHLQPKDIELRVLEPTANGSILFRNQTNPRDLQEEVDDAKTNDNQTGAFQSVNLSDQFVKNFHLQENRIVRPRYMHTIDPGHFTEILWIMTTYLDSLSQTECIGGLVNDVQPLDTVCRVWLDPTKPLFQNLAIPYGLGLELGPVEFSIAHADFMDRYPRQRILATTSKLYSVEEDINGAMGEVFYIELELTHGFQDGFAEDTAVYVENPIIKRLAKIYQDILAPEAIFVVRGNKDVGTNQSGNADMQRIDLYEDMTKYFTKKEVQDLDFICAPALDVDIKSGPDLFEQKQDKIRGRGLIYNKPSLQLHDSDGDATDNTDDAVELVLRSNGISIVRDKPFIGSVGTQVDGVELSGNEQDGIRVWSAAFTHPTIPPFRKIFERSYEIHDDEKIDVFVVYDRAAQTFTEIPSMRSVRFRNTCKQLAEMLHVLDRPEKKLEESHLVAAGKGVLAEIFDKINLFPTLATQPENQYKIHGKNRRALLDLTPEILIHVQNSGFETKGIGLINPEDFTNFKAGNSSSAIIQWSEADERRSAILAIAGQRAIIITSLGELNAKIVHVSNSANGYVTASVDENDNDATVFDGFVKFPNFNYENVQTLDVKFGGRYETGKRERIDLLEILRVQDISIATDFEVKANTEIRLYAGDYILATNFQCDDLMYYSSIAITSNDLLLQAVVSGDIKEVVLHQFPLAHTFGFSTDKNYSITGTSGNPPGMLTWRSKMTEFVPHQLMMSGAPIRRFSIRAIL